MSLDTHSSVPIREHLSDSGLRVTLHTPVATVEELFNQGIVTRSELEYHGFVIVDGITGPNEALPGETKLADGKQIQMIHKDAPSPSDPSAINVLTLRYPHGEKPRAAATMIGHAGTVLNELGQFLLDNPPPVHELMVQLRADIEALGVDRLHPEAKRADGQTWSDFALWHVANDVRGSGYEKTSELYAALGNILYEHRWKAGQVLLVNDSTMVHGRLPHPDKERGGHAFQGHWELPLTDEQIEKESCWLNNFELHFRPCSRRPDLGDGFRYLLPRLDEHRLSLFAAIDGLVAEHGLTYDALKDMREAMRGKDPMDDERYAGIMRSIFKRLRRLGFTYGELHG